jgi:hypothetical protein
MMIQLSPAPHSLFTTIDSLNEWASTPSTTALRHAAEESSIDRKALIVRISYGAFAVMIAQRGHRIGSPLLCEQVTLDQQVKGRWSR